MLSGDISSWDKALSQFRLETEKNHENHENPVYPLILLLGLLVCPEEASAYIGPGAGFALIGSALGFLATFLIAVFLFFFWPIRLLWKKIAGKKISPNAKVKRVIVVGLDGLDPRLTMKYMKEGRLPNFKKLREEGYYQVLKTTCPSISPVAWSTFQTGVNPGGHNIFDFLTRDKTTYLPVLSSTKTSAARKALKFGKWQIPLSKPEVKLLRKSKPFWKILGENGIFSNVIRVPITYPPEKFNGNILAAMCTPDLKGTQGTFSLYSSNGAGQVEKTGGNQIRVEVKGERIQSYLEGPDDPTLKEKQPLRVPFAVKLNGNSDGCAITIGGKTIPLKVNELSDWIKISFKTSLGLSVQGICRFCLRQVEPYFELHASPVNIDPDSPALPVAAPSYYSKYLAKLNGPFGTLGLMEDTWALNEGALDEEAFLKQAYLTQAERERIFFDALDKTSEGVCVCVFDGTDRIQHTFWRYLEQDHPAPKPSFDKFKSVIPDLYGKMDDLIGRVTAKLSKDDVLFVLSDHGFKSFRRCVNLNTWLWKNGYLKLKENRIQGRDYFRDVDWSGTKAFAIGMGAVFLNLKGREAQGIVDPSEAKALKQEIASKLLQLTDTPNSPNPKQLDSTLCALRFALCPTDSANSTNPIDSRNPISVIRTVLDADTTYSGPYKDQAPDLTVGWEDGYRASWECVTGKLKEPIIEDNTKAWSGDHCVDSAIVPGVFFCNRKIGQAIPSMVDIAPTILSLFDVMVPRYVDGKPLGIS